MSKKIVCSRLTGKIYYADINEKTGIAKNKEEINELDFLIAMVEKVMHEKNKIVLEDQHRKYILKLEFVEKVEANE